MSEGNRFVGAAGDKARRLEKRVEEDDDAYGALQTYKTFHARANKKEDFVSAVDLCRSGSTILLKKQHLTAGTELALLLVETLESAKIEEDADAKAVVLEVAKAFEEVENKKDAAKNQARFLKACIVWSQLSHCGNFEKGDPALHRLAAGAKVRMGDISGAATHYLHAREPKEFATFLYQWTSMGYQGERDLFLARAVLQLLALENLKDANTLYDTFVGLLAMKKTPLQDTPLAHFVKFLLRAVECDAYPLFKMLCEKYQPSIQRDANFQMYLDRISEMYFGIKAQKRGFQAIIDSMLQGFGG
ncbi:Golgi to ER traffic protein 4-like [Hondaea fermentalgiana]|uniref:Golgi to ER traffic protein 4-like n=1 Tax=Hondaea fermentalgiana TaxID=2315210 RepID=A0A2R5GE43_9STRA|nr:Golgi to ER traffic protein 4-like [Hondaea fermentalgiana]|eukprot:GBG29212.1 Golgi to ER traffic protein 4-like [Hondaea fermentalgiana]